MSARDDYRDVVGPYLAPGFTFDELCPAYFDRKRQLPPPSLQDDVVPVIVLANELRSRMIAAGARGLRLTASFRPHGGASNSQHKRNRALDLDLLYKDWSTNDELRTVYYEVATRMWCELGREQRIGLGLYCSPGRTAGVRVHLDVGYRTRTWQHSGTGSVSPPAARAIAKRLGLRLPTDTDDHS